MSVASPASEYHIPIVAWLNGIVRRIAETTAWLNVALILVIVVQVVMRYGFNKGMVPLEELMWHLYAVAFMFGMAYAVTNDSHIRVDVVHMALPKRVQHLFEIIGILLLLMPVLWILFDHSLGWAIEAYRVNESSQNPTGLPYRWIIKSVVPATMVLIFMAALARLIQEVSLLFHHGKEPDDQFPGRVSMMRRLFKPQQRKDDRNDGGVR
ncbi:MAG: TRAP transporter small permease subunit [Candidatus Thiodiazotropha endolucinida]|nr:TRAP transporter small permease subunit [Candidatus Thiodiazotropha taylori]MCG8094661.1 TRAP transporter small permease subunit [Candidatus Thiodiazotropha endolucinida]MCG8058530.1 TRAP transporter small permease subunit [Candidatus Thiodiazotropha taylori]MCG8064408.1 TRAP transporter small permease subunit [Candidatus Thiodiazotropha taylori]MCW4330494.1 TRAP transporter small permease subunit [Candidatus Thiodiazotropha endolucinida]